MTEISVIVQNFNSMDLETSVFLLRNLLDGMEKSDVHADMLQSCHDLGSETARKLCESGSCALCKPVGDHVWYHRLSTDFRSKFAGFVGGFLVSLGTFQMLSPIK